MSEPSSHRTTAAASDRAGSVRWGQGPFAFELVSNDHAVLTRVATIVSSWPADPDTRVTRRWRVQPVESSDADVWEAWALSPAGEAAELLTRGTPPEVMQAVEFDGVRELLHHPDQILGLHGALVSKVVGGKERGVALIGPCFSGKSTFSCALWSSGWSFLGDDVTLFDEEGRAFSAPRRASMRSTSRALIGETLWARAEATRSADKTAEGLLFHPHEVDGQSRPHHTRLAAIVFLARYNTSVQPAELKLVPAVDGALALLPYSNLREVPFPTALSRIAPIAETVSIYDLGRGSIDAMVARLNQLIESSSDS